MATVALLGSVTWNTTAGDKTVVTTPQTGDLILVVAGTSGLAGGTTSVSDNAGDGGTYSQIDSDRTGFSTTGVGTMWIRDRPILAPVSTTFTASQGSSTGGGLGVIAVRGMAKFGANAIRQTSGESSGTLGTTPAPILTRVPDLRNPIVGAVWGGATGAIVTARTAITYTELFDNGYNTPATAMEIMSVDSGETSATITWGSTVGSVFADIVVELDAATPTSYTSGRDKTPGQPWEMARQRRKVAPAHPYGNAGQPRRGARNPAIDLNDPAST